MITFIWEWQIQGIYIPAHSKQRLAQRRGNIVLLRVSWTGNLKIWRASWSLLCCHIYVVDQGMPYVFLIQSTSILEGGGWHVFFKWGVSSCLHLNNYCNVSRFLLQHLWHLLHLLYNCLVHCQQRCSFSVVINRAEHKEYLDLPVSPCQT